MRENHNLEGNPRNNKNFSSRVMTNRKCQLGFSLKKPQKFLVEFFGGFSMTLFCDFWSGICSNKILFVVLPQLNCWGPRKCVWQRVSTEYGIEEISIDNLYIYKQDMLCIIVHLVLYIGMVKPLKFVCYIYW